METGVTEASKPAKRYVRISLVVANHALAPGRANSVRGFWILCGMVAFAAGLCYTYRIVMAFYSQATNTITTIVNDDKHFPAVTVCNLNPYTMTKAVLVPQLADKVIDPGTPDIAGVDSLTLSNLKCPADDFLEFEYDLTLNRCIAWVESTGQCSLKTLWDSARIMAIKDEATNEYLRKQGKERHEKIFVDIIREFNYNEHGHVLSDRPVKWGNGDIDVIFIKHRYNHRSRSQIVYINENDGNWVVYDHQMKGLFACEIPFKAYAKCPEGWVGPSYDGQCYRVLKGYNRAVIAEKLCKSFGARLPIFASVAEYKFFKTLDLPQISWTSIFKRNGDHREPSCHITVPDYRSCSGNRSTATIEHLVDHSEYCQFLQDVAPGLTNESPKYIEGNPCPINKYVIDFEKDPLEIRRCVLHLEYHKELGEKDCLYPNNCDEDLAGTVCQIDVSSVPKNDRLDCTLFADNADMVEIKGQKLSVSDLTAASAALPFQLTGLSDDMKQGLGFSYEEVIQYCIRGGHRCNYSMSIATWSDPSYGNCYIHEPEENNTLGVLCKDMVIWIATDKSELIPLTETTGIRVTIQEPNIVTFPNVHGISVPFHYHSKFTVQRIEKKMISKRERPCHPKTTDLSEYFYGGGYTVEGCLRSCLQNETFNWCRCYNPNLAVPNVTTDSKMCDGEMISCTVEVQDRIHDDSIQEVPKFCRQCVPPCQKSYYDVVLSQTLLTKDDIRKQPIKFGGNKTKEHVVIPNKLKAKVTVTMATHSFRHHEEHIEKTIPQLISDFGGILGICLGASAITLIESVLLVFLWKDG